MSTDHGENAVPGAGSGPGRFASHAEAEGRFDIVVRGYDRRQVDEHIANLERTISRQRSELQKQPPPARPAPNREPVGNSPEKIGEFTGRLKSILEAAEEEAKEIRAEARNYARVEEEAARARLADLERRRDGLMSDLTRVRGNLDGLLARYAGPPAPKTPPEGNPLPAAAGSAPRAEKVPTPAPRPDAAKPATGQPARAGLANPSTGPTPRTDTPGRPAAGSPSPTAKPVARSGVGPGVGSEENGRPVTPRAVPSSPAGSSGSTPGSTPGLSTPPSPKPRPTPSPRPRATPPSGVTPAGLGQPAAGPVSRGTEQPARNGVLNRDNGTGPKRDDEGGHSAFGSGAR